jgi:hypothetical protein
MPRHCGGASRGTNRHAAVGQYADRRQIRDMLQIDDALGRPPPLAQLRHEIGAACERASVTRVHRRDRVSDALGPFVDELLQWTLRRIPRRAASLYGRLRGREPQRRNPAIRQGVLNTIQGVSGAF